jgi:tRNA(fMet)-specific endonuclease VapC
LSFLLDTNVCIALMKRHPAEVDANFLRAVAEPARIAVSSITAFELWYGVAKSVRVQENSARLKVFFSGPVSLLPFDDEDARIAGQVRAGLEAKGRPIGPYDVLLAGQALRHGLTLVTANIAEFARVPHLKWQDWATPRR